MYRGIFALVLLLSALFSGISCASPANLSIIINDYGGYTNSTSVSLQLFATGAVNCSYANSVLEWSEFEPYADARQWDLPPVDGVRPVYYKCIDSEGNESGVVGNTTILDTTAPTIGQISPGNKSIATSLRPSISATLGDSGSGIEPNLTVFRLNGGLVNASYNPGTGHLNYTPESDLNETAYFVEIVAFDRLGHSASLGWNFTVDQLPVIGAVQPGDGSYVSSRSFTIQAEISDSGSGISQGSTTMKINGSAVSVSFASGKIEHRAGLSEGNHTIVLEVYDNNGNLAAKTWHIFVDETAPVIDYLVPADKSTVALVPVISGRISDSGSGIKESTMKMKVNGLDVTRETAYSNGLLSFPIVGMVGGEHWAEISVDDNAGNPGSRRWDFTIASKAPAIGALTPANASSTRETKPVISAKITDPGTGGLDMNSLYMALDNNDVSGKASYDPAKQVISYRPLSDLSEGRHTVKVSAMSMAGNKTEKKWEFTIDLTGPDAPVNLKITRSGASAILSWSAVDEAAKYNIYRSTSMIASVSGLNAYRNTTGATITDQAGSTRYYYAVTALDALGNEGKPAYIGTCADYSNGWVDYECCSDADCGTNKCNTTSKKCYYPGSSQATAQQTIISQAPQNPTAQGNGTEGSEDETPKKKPLPCTGGFIVLGILAAVSCIRCRPLTRGTRIRKKPQEVFETPTSRLQGERSTRLSY